MRKKLDLTQLLTLGAVLVTLALAVPSYIAANTQAEQARNEAGLARQEAETAAQGQLTDRFSKAIEQLGATDNLEVRLGGIYALERIARDSPRDHPTVMNVLSTFVRENTKKLRTPEGSCTGGPPTADVQAAMTVFVHPEPGQDRGRASLSDACLSGVDLFRADLTGVYLIEVDLTLANFNGANFTDAQLQGSDLSGTYLNDADLTDADLTEASFFFAQLNDADLTDADLTDANLLGARLSGADLTDAHLGGARLSGADLTDATGLPPGWTPPQ